MVYHCIFFSILKSCFFFLPKTNAIFLNYNWRVVSLQYCDGYCHTSTWMAVGMHVSPPSCTPSHLPSHPVPSRLSQSTSFGFAFNNLSQLYLKNNNNNNKHTHTTKNLAGWGGDLFSYSMLTHIVKCTVQWTYLSMATLV